MEDRLLAACENGEISTVRKLLKTLPKINVNVQDDMLCSPLAKACKGGHFTVAHLLLQSQADINSTDRNWLTPLHLAAKGNYEQLVKLLILHGAKVDAKSTIDLRPIDLVNYDSPIWNILKLAKKGKMPNIEEYNEVPVIPDFAIANGAPKKKVKKGKKGKKGGKKKGKKKKK